MTAKCPCCGSEFALVLTTQSPAVPVCPPDRLPGYEDWRATVAIQCKSDPPARVDDVEYEVLGGCD